MMLSIFQNPFRDDRTSPIAGPTRFQSALSRARFAISKWRDCNGNALGEYVSVVAFTSVGVIASIGAYGEYVRDSYDSSTWEVEREIVVNTGYVSGFKDKKALGIAKDYTGTITFMFEEAGYRNALGMYKFDENGLIHDIQIIFANSSAKGSGGNLIPGESSVEVDLEARDQIGFFVASNAYSQNSSKYLTTGSYQLLDEDGNPATLLSEGLLTLWQKDPTTEKLKAIRTQYARNLFYSHADPAHEHYPNVDGYPHTVGWVDKETGVVTLGFEDLYSGGDNDYDDVILEFDVGRANAAVLDPNIEYDYDGYEDWARKLKLWEDE